MNRNGGLTGNRTRVQGFADRERAGDFNCLAANRPDTPSLIDWGFLARCKPKTAPPAATKNPGSLAGDTGAPNGSASRQDQHRPYTILRTVFNDDGHFIGLEVAHG